MKIFNLKNKKGNLKWFKFNKGLQKANKLTAGQCENVISVPSKELVKQNEIKTEKVKIKDGMSDVFCTSDEYLNSSHKVIIGPMASGKTYYMMNKAKNTISLGNSLVIIDTEDNCNLSEKVKLFVPKDKLVEIDCADLESIQSFSYNELKITDDMSCDNKIRIIQTKVKHMLKLVEAINGEPLSCSMIRYFNSASTVVFYTNQNAILKEIIDVLVDVDKRMEAISKLSEEDKELLRYEVSDLEALNNETKFGTKTKYTKIEHILDRISFLRKDIYTRLAFDKDASKDIDFVNAINEKKAVLIKIPANKINSVELRDFIANFYLSKIWLAKQLSSSKTKTELLFHELSPYKMCKKTMKEELVSYRLFNLISVIGMNDFGFCDRRQDIEFLLALRSSFILMSGCNKKIFHLFEDYFERNLFTEGDLGVLKKYHALCLLDTEKGYKSCIVKLPS